MGQMIRKQVYIEPRQEYRLKELAGMLGITEAELIRRAIDQQAGLLSAGIRDLGAWEREKNFISTRMKGPVAPSKRRFRREEAYEERLTRYGR